MDEQMLRMMELAQMMELPALIREKTLLSFNADWKPFLDFLLETEKNEIMLYGFDDQKKNSR